MEYQRTRNFYIQLEENLHRYGKRPAREISYSIDRAKEVLCEEKKAGEGKLSGTIGEIVDSPHGRERFVDRHVVYLPPTGKLIVIADLHGDYRSLVSILIQSGFLFNNFYREPSHLLFLGDLINRGADPVGVADLAVTLKGYFPDSVDILMGNHEEMAISDRNSPKTTSEWLSGVLIRRFEKNGLSLNDRFVSFFENLPTLAVAGNGLGAMHGGVPHQKIGSMLDLQVNEELLRQLRWNYFKPKDDHADKADKDIKAKYERRNQQREVGKEEVVNFMRPTGIRKITCGHRISKSGFTSHLNGDLVELGSTGPSSSDSYIKSDFRVVPRWLGGIPLALPAHRIDLTRTNLTRPSPFHPSHLHEVVLGYYNGLPEPEELEPKRYSSVKDEELAKILDLS